jgi:mRNA interferase HigB
LDESRCREAPVPIREHSQGSRVVFNIAGNALRLVTKVHCGVGIVYISFVGTHAQYDAIDAESI